MTKIEQMAAFVSHASYDDLSESAIRQIKIRILDSLGCAIGALNGEPVRKVQRHILNFGGNELCTMIGGGKTSPDGAAFYNSALINELGLEKVMFEAADPEVFAWYIKNYGPDVNLFVDHSQIVQLECLRSGIWGTKSLWGRVLTF